MTMIATDLRNQRETAITQNLRSNMSKLKEQIDYQTKGTNYHNLNKGDIVLDSALSASIKLHETYARSTNQNKSALQLQVQKIKTGLNELGAFKNLLSNANSQFKIKDANLKALAENVKLALDNVLKARSGGSYIFGGKDGRNSPIDTSNPNQLTNGTFYQGAKESKSIHLNNLKESFELGIRGDHQAFKDAYQAIQKIIDNPTSLAELKASQNLIDSAFDGLNQSYSKVASQVRILETESEANKAASSRLSEQKKEVTGIDMPTLVEEMHNMKFAMEVTYMLKTMLPRFVDFIK